MVLASPINATSIPVIILSFYHRYATEAGRDFCNLEVSNDNGATWQAVANYSGTLSTWTQQALDITDYAAGFSQFKVRFRLTSDASVTADGWYVDDIRILGYVSSLAGVRGNPDKLPLSFALHQNFPNPFNPETNIAFDLPKSSYVTLKVYDLLGQEMATVVQQQLPAGSHSYRIAAQKTGLASGVYFYRLAAERFIQTRKMIVLR